MFFRVNHRVWLVPAKCRMCNRHQDNESREVKPDHLVQRQNRQRNLDSISSHLFPYQHRSSQRNRPFQPFRDKTVWQNENNNQLAKLYSKNVKNIFTCLSHGEYKLDETYNRLPSSDNCSICGAPSKRFPLM